MLIYSSLMSSPERPATPIERPARKQRKCGVCRQSGHDRRNCPTVVATGAPASASVPAGRQGHPHAVTCEGSPTPLVVATIDDVSSVDWEKALYVVFDLETTGRSRQRDEIIELVAVILDSSGVQIEDAVFTQFVKPHKSIPSFITELTSITNNDVASAENFSVVADSFIRFMQQVADEHDDSIQHLILVGHNAKVFDIPFFLQQLTLNKMTDLFFQDDRFGIGLDTLSIARTAVRKSKTASVPSSFNLSTLFQYITGRLASTWHRALADVNATSTILRFPLFWATRKECAFKFYRPPTSEERNVYGPTIIDGPTIVDPTNAIANATVHEPIMDDSDAGSDSEGTSVSSSGNSSSSSLSDDDSVPPLGDQWETGCLYEAPVPSPIEKFQETFTSIGRSRRQRTGLQCSPIDVNTPIRAWREVFKNTLLEKIGSRVGVLAGSEHCVLLV